jgi:hypothetical protein
MGSLTMNARAESMAGPAEELNARVLLPAEERKHSESKPTGSARDSEGGARHVSVQSAAFVEAGTQRVTISEAAEKPMESAKRSRSELIDTALESHQPSQQQHSRLQSADFVNTDKASSRKVAAGDAQVTEPDMSRAGEEQEMSRYSIAQNQVNMPLTDYYEKKYDGTPGQRFSADAGFAYAQGPPSDSENPLMAQARLMR